VSNDVAPIIANTNGAARGIVADGGYCFRGLPFVAFSALVSDANFACPALQIDRWTAQWVPTFAYEFNDDNAPLRYPPTPAGPPVATHKSEFPYLFDLPDAPLQEPLSWAKAGLQVAPMDRSVTRFRQPGPGSGLGVRGSRSPLSMHPPPIMISLRARMLNRPGKCGMSDRAGRMDAWNPSRWNA
jgi:carboxylesterase type B